MPETVSQGEQRGCGTVGDLLLAPFSLACALSRPHHLPPTKPVLRVSSSGKPTWILPSVSSG